jgi:uncharacterized protein involved in exopolysaccharide biosynthesis
VTPIVHALFLDHGLLKPKIRRYIPVIPVCLVASLGWSVYDSSRRTVSYTTDSRIVVSARVNVAGGNMLMEDATGYMGTQLTVLQSEEVKNRASARLRSERPELTGTPDINANFLPRTTIISITATSQNQQLVQPFLNALMEEYIAFRRDRRVETSRVVMKDVSAEIARLEKVISGQENDLLRYKQRNNIGFWELQSNEAARNLSQLKTRDASLRMQLRLIEQTSKLAGDTAREGQMATVAKLASSEGGGENRLAGAFLQPA